MMRSRRTHAWRRSCASPSTCGCRRWCAPRAEILYNLLRPYADRNVVIGLGGGCNGAAGRFLGTLAVTLDRPEEADARFAAAAEFNRRMEAWPWLARTQFAWASMILSHV